MLEIELKARLRDIPPAALARRLTKIGFAPGSVIKSEDVYFRDEDQKNSRVKNRVLRLRASRDLPAGTACCQITYKGPARTGLCQSREEVEIEVEDADAAGVLLERLGFTPFMTVRKTRRHYQMGDITACLDAVEGLGPFLELEVLAPEDDPRQAGTEQRLLALLEEVGLGTETLIRQSYLELLQNEH